MTSVFFLSTYYYFRKDSTSVSFFKHSLVTSTKTKSKQREPVGPETEQKNKKDTTMTKVVGGEEKQTVRKR